MFPYHQRRQPRSNNDSLKKRKRKGPSASEIQEATNSQGSTGDLPRSWQSISTPVLTPDEIYQCAVAGHSIEVELPGAPFPHAGYISKDGLSRFDSDTRHQLKPAHLSPDEMQCHSLHQQHLAVMTTILHKSLMEEDYMRAARALGMILRDEMGGRPTNIRAEGSWGIGAEILTRRETQTERARREPSSTATTDQDLTHQWPNVWFTRRGMEDAKKYYERLIVQYPFYNQNRHSVSALDFYPAMFGLWIYAVHQEAKLNAFNAQAIVVERESEESLAKTREYPTAPPGQQFSLQELKHAKEIADRMDSVMGQVPYRDSCDLRRLRNMVQAWIIDLEDALPKPTEEDDPLAGREDTPMGYLTSRGP